MQAAPGSPRERFDEERLARQGRARAGANWFFWIAGLSALNSILFLVTGSLTLIFGLTVTQVVDGVASGAGRVLAQQSGPAAGTMVRLAGFALDLALAGAFAAFGTRGRRGGRRAVIAGVILYVLDGLLALVFRQWAGLVFHVLMLWGPWRAMQALNELDDLESERRAAEEQESGP